MCSSLRAPTALPDQPCSPCRLQKQETVLWRLLEGQVGDLPARQGGQQTEVVLRTQVVLSSG